MAAKEKRNINNSSIAKRQYRNSMKKAKAAAETYENKQRRQQSSMASAASWRNGMAYQ